MADTEQQHKVSEDQDPNADQIEESQEGTTGNITDIPEETGESNEEQAEESAEKVTENITAIPEEPAETVEQANGETQENTEDNAGAHQENDAPEVDPEIEGGATEVTEEQAEVTEKQTDVNEEPTEVIAEQTEAMEEQTEVTEEQTAEGQSEVADDQTEQAEAESEQIETKEQAEEGQTQVEEETTEALPAEEEQTPVEQEVDQEEVIENGDLAPEDLELSDEKKNKLREVFELYATDGAIDYKGFKKLVRCFGQNPVEAESREWYSTADQNSDGQISFSEFCRLFLQHKQPEDVLKDEILNCVKRLFPNDKDEIELKKVIQIMSKLEREASDLCQSDIKRFCEEMDISGNGKIDAAEFVSSLCGSGLSL